MNFNEEAACVGFELSTVAARCMYRNKSINNHCGNMDAQNIGLRNAETPIPDASEATTKKYDLGSCYDCRRFKCAYFAKEEVAANPLGGLTEADIVILAATCEGFEHKEVTL